VEISQKTPTEKPTIGKRPLTEEITNIKSPNDLLTIFTNPDSQAQPPRSPKKRIRSLSPPPANNLTPVSSPLSIPAMTDIPDGPGQGVKRTRRKQ